MLKFIKGRDFLCVWLRFMITMTGCTVWGFVVRYVMKNKGYQNLGAWFCCGFFLGIIGLVIAITRPDLRNQPFQNGNPYGSPYGNPYANPYGQPMPANAGSALRSAYGTAAVQQSAYAAEHYSRTNGRRPLSELRNDERTGFDFLCRLRQQDQITITAGSRERELVFMRKM